MAASDLKPASPASAVQCPTCGAQFGGMAVCPWDGATLEALPDADPTAVAFYAALAEVEASDDRKDT